MNYQLTLVSPVHIGTGNMITPFEYIACKGRFVLVALDKLLRQSPQRAGDFAQQVEQQQQHFALGEFLTADEQQNTAYWMYSAALHASVRNILQEELQHTRDMDVAECLKNPVSQEVYIPGSSVKGALRTAFAHNVLRSDEKLFQHFKERLHTVDWRHSDEAVNDLIFWGAQKDPKYDLFRMLRISDSSALPADVHTLEVGKMKVLSLYETSPKKEASPRQGTMFKQLQEFRQNLSTPNRSPMKPWWTCLEIVKSETSFTGDITLEAGLSQSPAAQSKLRWRAPHQKNFSLQELLKAANTFALDVCHWELNFFERYVEGIDVTPVLTFYHTLKTSIQDADDSSCYLCLGQGAGWHKLTLGMLLEQDHSFDFRKLRKELRLASGRLNFPYPKSRKLLMASDADIQSVLGWVKLQLA